MTILLAVETSAKLCSLAIHIDGRWIEDTQNVERLHNQVVLGNLEALSRAAGVDRGAFHGVTFAAGPGSFTGIRIAASLAQGIAYACAAGVVPVSSSLALARAAQRHGSLPAAAGGVLTVTRSRRDAYYVAGFTLPQQGIAQRVMDDRLVVGIEPPVDLPPRGWVGVGDRPPWWPETQPFLDDAAVTAAVVGELALPIFNAGEALPPTAALPVYISGDSPWKPAVQ